MTQSIEWQPHLIIDDFLLPEHYEQVCNTAIPEKPDQYGVVIYGNIDNRLNFANIEKHYHDCLMDYLRELDSNKIEQYEWTNIAINLTGPECNFDIHTDNKNKLLSVVVYLEPEQSTGTLLYSDQSGQNAQMVEWKPNRAFIFSRNDFTWHSYKGDGKSVRKVLGINLMTNIYGW
jgi:hypothetical protein